MFSIYDGRESFFQWDLNRKLIIEDASITEVHFCNGTEDCALVVEVFDEDGARVCNVPNIILQDIWKVKVYAFDGEATRHSAIFKVEARNKPADYVYTETEIKRWEEFEGRIKALEDASGDVPDVSDALAEFKEKEMEWERVYKYNVANFPSYIHSLTIEKSPRNDVYALKVTSSLTIARHFREDGLKYLVETPLKVEAKEQTNGYIDFKIPNIHAIYDAGIVVEGEIVPFSYMAEAFIDGETYTEGFVEISTAGTTSQPSGTGYAKASAIVYILSPSEEAIDTILPEIQPIFEAYGDNILHFYRHIPEVEVVEAQYIGG
jgi:hypothetical protein